MVCSAGIWAWQAHAQNRSIQGNKSTQPSSQSTIALQATGSNWQCQKFILGQEKNAGHDTVRDLEGFLQAATQATITSSGVPDTGPFVGHYDIVACRKP
jgi:hypothetical protein